MYFDRYLLWFLAILAVTYFFQKPQPPYIRVFFWRHGLWYASVCLTLKAINAGHEPGGNYVVCIFALLLLVAGAGAYTNLGIRYKLHLLGLVLLLYGLNQLEKIGQL